MHFPTKMTKSQMQNKMKQQLLRQEGKQRKDARKSIGKWRKNEKRCDKISVIR